LTYNRREQIAQLLGELSNQAYDAFEVIVVDNASTDGTPEFIQVEHPEVRLLRCATNMGTYSYSLGLQQAEGTYLLIMDDDGLPTDDQWIASIVERFESNPSLGAAACTIRMQDTGQIAHDSPQFMPDEDTQTGYPTVAYNGTGAGLRASAVQNLLPAYPRMYFRSWIELHLCTRLLRAGWEVRHFPDIEVWHCRPSNSAVPEFSYYGLRNYYWYVLQFYPWPHWVNEILHHVVGGLRLMPHGTVRPALWLRAFLDAMRGVPTVVRQRDPVDPELLAYLRTVRRHGRVRTL
jgi:GT2 family glycosyltransferase